MTCFCGLPMSKNPHPNAGDPSRVTEVGAVWVCIPCSVKALSGWSRRALLAERRLDDAMALLGTFRFWRQKDHATQVQAVLSYYDLLAEYLAR